MALASPGSRCQGCCPSSHSLLGCTAPRTSPRVQRSPPPPTMLIAGSRSARATDSSATKLPTRCRWRRLPASPGGLQSRRRECHRLGSAKNRAWKRLQTSVTAGLWGSGGGWGSLSESDARRLACAVDDQQKSSPLLLARHGQHPAQHRVGKVVYRCCSLAHASQAGACNYTARKKKKKNDTRGIVFTKPNQPPIGADVSPPPPPTLLG